MARKMIFGRQHIFLILLMASSALLWHATQTPAQQGSAGPPPPITPQPAGPGNDRGGLILDASDFLGPAGPLGRVRAGQELALSAHFEMAQGTRFGRLSVTAEPAPGWHVYSTTQQPGGPMTTVLTVLPTLEYEVLEAFAADRAPSVKHSEFFPVPVEEHHEKVVWTATVRIAAGVDPANLTIDVVFDGQVCDDAGEIGCREKKDVPLAARLAGVFEAGVYRDEASHVTLHGHVEPTTAQAGGKLKLVIEANPEPNWHIYAHQDRDPEIVGANKPTLLVLTDTGPWTVTGPVALSEAVEHETGIPEAPLSHYFEEPVQWVFELHPSDDAPAGESVISGVIGYQTCSAASCDMPLGANFSVVIPAGAAGESVDRLPLAFWDASYDRAAAEAAKRLPDDGSIARLEMDLSTIAFGLLAAFLGGLILNVMPCVLPVIGLKLMSFVKQAGESRWRVFALNLWYSLGMLAVFMVFATSAVVLKFAYGTTITWGGQFSDPRFSIPMAAVLFVFGLSLFGIWEIPIPGFVGSGKASDLASREGAFGAFFKGALTTVLATPCSGPFVLTAVGFAVAAPVWLTYTAFGLMGVGMASPFLIVGVFPAIIRVLPKPGGWMNTFKQLMGFVLMATIVWFFSFISTKYTVSTLSLLVGLGVSCWIVGRTPLTADLAAKLKAWAYAGVVTAATIWFSFVVLFPKHELPWLPFSRPVLEQHLAEGHTVLVDFTANW